MRTTRRTFGKAVAGGLALAGLGVTPAGVRVLSRVSAQEPAARIVVQGLTSPRGLLFASDGAMYIVEAGIGGTDPATIDVPPPIGPWKGGLTSTVVRQAGECAELVAKDLPSGIDAIGGVEGGAGIVEIEGALYVLCAGGPAHGAPKPSGIYRIEPDGSSTLVVDLNIWMEENLVEQFPEVDYDAGGSWYNLTLAPDGATMWAVESNSEQVVAITTDGVATRIIDVSSDNSVPTAVLAAPQGGWYVAYLSSAPFPDGSARVIHVAEDGTRTDAWTGLTMVTDLAQEADGTILATEMATGILAAPPFYTPNTGRLVRLGEGGSVTPVATGLNLPVVVEVGPDGAAYVSCPATMAGVGEGYVVRIDLAAALPVDASAAAAARIACPVPNPEIEVVAAAMAAAAEAAAAAAGTPAATDASAPAATAAVTIVNMAFDPEALTVAAGTTVTWTNQDLVPHNVVAIDPVLEGLASPILNQGESFSFTFTEAGTVQYICAIHPAMKASVTVTA
jgi:plastocyanin